MTTGKFWRGLDQARSLVKSGDMAAVEELLAELDMTELQTAPPGTHARRRALLDDFARTYRLSYTLRSPGEEPEVASDAGTDDVDRYVQIVQPGVSLVTCCKNRNENLIKALPSWIACREIDQIVIVDWCSDRDVAADIAAANIDDPRILVARVQDEPRWILSYAFNLGFRLARHADILKVDADIVLGKTFFADNALEPGTFIAGNWRTAVPGQEFVNGFFYVPRDALMGIKGFNEHITTYGWDDDDLYERLNDAGLARRDVAPGTVHHLDHDDEERLGDAPPPDMTVGDHLATNTMAKIRTNRFIATIMPYWNGDRRLLPYDIFERAPGLLRMRRRGPMPHPVPAIIETQARDLAAIELISWRLGLRAFEMTPTQLKALLARPGTLDDLTIQDLDRALAGPGGAQPADLAMPQRARPAAARIIVDAQHGLGNRLRAWASGAAIARATGRELVLVWEPDHHCECTLGDLFAYDGAVEECGFIETARARGAQVVNYMEIEAGSAKDAPIVLDPARDLYARSAYVLNAPQSSWEAENAFLRGLTPTEAIQEMMAGVPDHRDLALHVRMEGAAGTDQASYDAAENWTAEGHAAINHWRAQSHYGKFIERVDRVLAEMPDTRMFLASDRPEAYAAFRETFGDRVAILERTTYDRSAAQIQSALADVLLLARCKAFLGSNWSSFSELAVRLSPGFAWQEMSGIDF